MDKTKFSFDLVDKYTPEDVIKKSLVQINDATQGYVKGNIEEYGGSNLEFYSNKIRDY